MKSRNIILSLSAIACICLSGCSIKFGFVNDSSSSETSNRREESSFINDILEKGYSATDSGEVYHLDGDFSMYELNELSKQTSNDWNSLTDSERYAHALNILNFFAYYGDDASVRFKPSELVEGITQSDGNSVLEAAFKYASPANEDKYLAIIGVIDINNIVNDESTDTQADAQE